MKEIMDKRERKRKEELENKGKEVVHPKRIEAHGFKHAKPHHYDTYHNDLLSSESDAIDEYSSGSDVASNG